MQTLTKLSGKILLLATLALAITGCGSLKVADARDGSDLIVATDVYTLVNLHPDEARARIYTVNYQQPGLIPVCSKVNLIDANKKALKFNVVDSGRQYMYYLHRSLPEPFTQHLGQIFGKQCPQDKIARMSRLDREGIKAGIAKVGMTKEAVVIAMGPPPAHVTRSLESDDWTYWQNRWVKMRVEFENGKVARVVD